LTAAGNTRAARNTRAADPGLAGERTELAWTRTAISFAALGGAILKNHPAAGFPGLALSVVIWKLGQQPGRHARGLSRRGRLLLITVAVTGVSLGALAITLLGGESAGLRL
jgi:uncharacterized membrane protein YidH (DUF202 family)